MNRFFNESIETMDRPELDRLIDERIRYTVKYAGEHSPFYKKWFREQGIDPDDVHTHEDLLKLPVISGKTIRENQPPESSDFNFRSVSWNEVYTIHETSGTSGVPKSFFLTWKDWERYAEKYSRALTAQGFGPGDRVIVCSSYGMNIGANTMTLAAKDIGMTMIPEGKCTFPLRIIRNYRPTAIIGSVFKLLGLARRMEMEKISPKDSSVERLIIGGESFAAESRDYIEEIWGCDAYNIYGSTEGTMCGECSQKAGLHVPEDLVHLDVYDPDMGGFVKDGECGRIVLTTLIPPGEKCGTLLINYDTEDTTVVLSREKCQCGRTHMKILYPQRESETFWVEGTPFNRVDVERGVFQRGNMAYLTGEYEAFLYGGDDEGETAMRLSLECKDPDRCDKKMIEENFLGSFFKYKPHLSEAYSIGTFKVIFNFIGQGGLELYRLKGRPKRIVDRR
ncbi:coenzyme F390 synthetase [Methanocella sp. CWC-04]|uniref:Coenzyme F390 synthetase n=1 Tax=Methanooceanicella nereidis TaxID=2052831 RepID=A0AAP2RC62_9EURY|nr:coenzyme F390 synthetase [Methanocella sp. CWC-04]MCD1293582.1 coenzyme F390 synthetase [Methanocella sp. CWC-04]